MANVKLSISILTPGGKYLEKCLQALDSLRTHITCELVIVDTGCNEEYRRIIEEYADQIVSFTWCDDFAAARNAGLEKCSGEWFLYLDDDEIMEDGEDLIRFLSSSDCEKYTYGYFFCKNYLKNDCDAEQFNVNVVTRLFRRDVGTRFVYPIHEGIPITNGAEGIELKVTLGHYGYYFIDRDALLLHSERNIRMLKKALLDYPDSSHLACQLAHEYQIIDDYAKQVDVCEHFFSITTIGSDDAAILACGWLAGLIGLGKYVEAIGLCRELQELSDSCKLALTSIYTYKMIALYHLNAYQEIAENAQLYEDAYQRGRQARDLLSYDFFVKNGFDAGYRSLISQMILITALKLKDERLVAYYKEQIAWSEPGLKLYEDLPRVLCEMIEINQCTPFELEFLEYVLQVKTVKNAVLQYKLRQLI